MNMQKLEFYNYADSPDIIRIKDNSWDIEGKVEDDEENMVMFTFNVSPDDIDGETDFLDIAERLRCHADYFKMVAEILTDFKMRVGNNSDKWEVDTDFYTYDYLVRASIHYSLLNVQTLPPI